MRWNNGFTLKKRAGEKRIVRKFLLWPRSFKEEKTRWLEWANIEEEIMQVDIGGSGEWGKYAWKWIEVKFTDDANP